ncbi:Lrp/AsnC family transcriptional regulator [Candidatus Woesearchaeota archaeon]|nr:Lrp/AsnC family transcriptional regulator [Candidatus Woesearchaeota archaeon]
MLDRKEMLILANLRNNARETLTIMSRKTSIPISTIFEKIKNYESGLIKKYTSIIDFTKLGYNTRATILIKVNKEYRDRLREHLLINKSLNNVYKINNGYDFLIDGIFKEIKDVEVFLDKLENEFGVTDKYVYYVVDEIKNEDFFSSQEYVNFTIK